MSADNTGKQNKSPNSKVKKTLLLEKSHILLLNARSNGTSEIRANKKSLPAYFALLRVW